MARVLVIEDEPLLRKRIASVLTSGGYEVVEAENGLAGIEKLQESGLPSVIILDMVMPMMNGWGFLDFQRNNGLFSGIPVVIISAYEEMAKSAKPEAFLTKPIEAKDVLDVVAKFCF